MEKGKDYTLTKWHRLDNYECARNNFAGNPCQFSTVDKRVMEEHVMAHDTTEPQPESDIIIVSK